MEIHVNHQLTIGEFKNRFAAEFPLLRLSICKLPWQTLLLSLVLEIAEREWLCDYQKERNPFTFNIRATDKVADFEQAFRGRFALELHVTRQSGNNWITTTSTDNYTIEQQNALGVKVLGKPMLLNQLQFTNRSI
ncbi:MAG: hypothetical protein M3R17_12000 [Bacteroidota bacterium]|nr:hypothetical protein [Bacteroidota bacterium]